jgi:hypothetical protein
MAVSFRIAQMKFVEPKNVGSSQCSALKSKCDAENLHVAGQSVKWHYRQPACASESISPIAWKLARTLAVRSSSLRLRWLRGRVGQA